MVKSLSVNFINPNLTEAPVRVVDTSEYIGHLFRQLYVVAIWVNDGVLHIRSRGAALSKLGGSTQECL